MFPEDKGDVAEPRRQRLESGKAERNTATPTGGSSLCSSYGKTILVNKKAVFSFYNCTVKLLGNWFMFFLCILVTLQFLVLYQICIAQKSLCRSLTHISRIKVSCACTESLTSMAETQKKDGKRPKSGVDVVSTSPASRPPAM